MVTPASTSAKAPARYACWEAGLEFTRTIATFLWSQDLEQVLNGNEAPDQEHDEDRGYEGEAPLDKLPDRIAEEIEKARDQEEAHGPRHDAGQDERDESHLRDAG